MYERINALCMARGITVAQLEKRLGFGGATISHWKESIPKADKLLLVANELGVTVEYLLTGNEGAYSMRFREGAADAISGASLADFEAAGIDHSRVQLQLSGKGPISFETVCELSDMLGYSVEEIMGAKKPAPTEGNGLTDAQKEWLQVIDGMDDKQIYKLLGVIKSVMEMNL